jgi:propionate CoA-transferase
MRALAKVVSLNEAISKIPSGSSMAISGFVGAGHPEYLTHGLEEYFLQTGSPRDLTLYYVAGQGDRGNRGLNHLAHEGLVACVYGGHWNLAPKMGELAAANKIQAYNFPQGVLSVLLRDIAAGRPGLITKVGLNTFVDPHNGGGRMNSSTTKDVVRRITIPEGEFLFYPAIPLNVALIRATSADARGNLSVEHEGLIGEILPMAQAVHNNGGIVIAQVERQVDEHKDPKSVRVPGILVDYVVVAPKEHHTQTFDTVFNPDLVTRNANRLPDPPHLPFSERRLIAERVAREIHPGEIVNLGIGLPEGVASIAAEQNLLDRITLTVEAGPVGGIPASGLSFGCSYSPEAVLDQPAQFDFYDGGGLDVAALGAAEIDQYGNVNVSRMGNRIPGAGGFINISQSAKRLIFCTSFTSGGLEVNRQDGKLVIIQEGRHRKFVRNVQQITFHGPSAVERNQSVLIVTERAVFSLEKEGLVLREIAPGIDLQTQILDLMDFAPVIRL